MIMIFEKCMHTMQDAPNFIKEINGWCSGKNLVVTQLSTSFTDNVMYITIWYDEIPSAQSSRIPPQ